MLILTLNPLHSFEGCINIFNSLGRKAYVHGDKEI
jgi:hypothetical protein